MKLIVDQSALLQELALLQGVIERKPTAPYLACALLNATEDGRLEIAATDLDVAYRASVEADVETPGTVLIHAKRFHDVIRKLPPANVGLRHGSGALQVECEKIRYRLSVSPVEDFPNLRQRQGSPIAAVEAALIEDMLRRVVHAIAIDDPRYALDGALWKIEDGELTLVATDGHRLALSRRPVSGESKGGLEPVIVPRKALAEIQRLAAAHDAAVDLHPAKGSLFFTFGGRELSTTLKDRKFPDYPTVIAAARENDLVATVDTAVLKAAIERVAVLSQEHTHLVTFSLSPATLKLSASHHDFGEAEEEIEVAYEGPPHEVGFNAQYVLDFLGSAGTESVRLSFGEGRKQGLFEPVRPDAEGLEDLTVIATLGA